MRVAVLAHIFWEDSWDVMKGYFFNLKESQRVEPVFIINTCFEIVADKIKKDLPEAHVLVSENGGVDIGGILMTLDFYLKHRFRSDFMIVMHDKKSSLEWFERLMTILHKDVIPIVLRHFARNNVGMVGAKWHIFENLDYLNVDLTQHYCDRFGLPNLKKGSENPKYYGFVAGTIFWVRSVVFENFFSLNSPLDLRLDTLNNYGVPYVVERLFGYLVTSNGYSIIGWENRVPKLMLV